MPARSASASPSTPACRILCTEETNRKPTHCGPIDPMRPRSVRVRSIGSPCVCASPISRLSPSRRWHTRPRWSGFGGGSTGPRSSPDRWWRTLGSETPSKFRPKLPGTPSLGAPLRLRAQGSDQRLDARPVSREAAVRVKPARGNRRRNQGPYHWSRMIRDRPQGQIQVNRPVT